MTLIPPSVHLPALYSTEGQGKQSVALVHLTHPLTEWHWYITERGTGEDADLVFGLVDGFELEYGYSDLRELAANGVVYDPDWQSDTLETIEQDCLRLR